MEDLDFTSPAREALYDPSVARACFESLGNPQIVGDQQAFFSEGQPSERMYLLTEGAVRLMRHRRPLDVIRPGEIFGEMAVLTGQPRTATALAKGDCRALSLDRAQFQNALTKAPEFALMLMSILIARLRLTVEIVSRSGRLNRGDGAETGRIFEQALLDDLATALKRRPQTFPARHPIIREGDKGGFMYLVLNGSVAISIKSQIIERAGPGAAIGEMALIDQSPRAASAIAETDSVLLPINRSDFLALVKSRPEFAVSLLRELALRLAQMTAQQA